ncbi:hypothetical protein DFH08DRAFT_510742 [Mycena albidolilacea]|uniref:Uncharacterized protein n=1 Tax=Mycena albidolilacea TaxID=1033008 RepID=A0AAD7AE21_9AGAR|nr:hypothetical protein DFH08DRAFT_510742 [Mycena albidolilacea]
MKAYLERSGQHPLSFRLSYNPFDQMREQPLLECLSGHSMRWKTVVIEGASQFTLDYLERSKPSDYSSLRSLDFFHCQLDSFDTSLPPFPWSQLSRYHEYDVSWYRDRDSVDQWSQLTNVVDLRVAFDETFNGSRPIKMPRLRFASLAVSQVDEMLSCFEFPGIQGLNLMFTTNQPPRTLRSVPAQLKGLRILRLSGDLGVAIAKTALLCLLAELTELTDFAMALRDNHGVDATYLFTLLTPGHSLLVPRLQALRVVTSEPVGETIGTLLVMLRQRFGGVKGIGRLKRFEIFLGLRPIVFGKRLPKSYTPSAMSQSLDWLRVHEGWDIRVVEEWQGDFWSEEMDTEFL